MLFTTLWGLLNAFRTLKGPIPELKRILDVCKSPAAMMTSLHAYDFFSFPVAPSKYSTPVASLFALKSTLVTVVFVRNLRLLRANAGLRYVIDVDCRTPSLILDWPK